MKKYLVNDELTNENDFDEKLVEAINNYILNKLDDLIDESYSENGEIKIEGITFNPSRILKELDPIAYYQVADTYKNNEYLEAKYILEKLNFGVEYDNITFRIEAEE